MALEIARTFTENMMAAQAAERSGDAEVAASYYEKAIKQEPHEEKAYRRLMIIYRKLYRYEDELRLIDKGIKVFTTLHQKRSKKLLLKNVAVTRLSRSLAKSLGLTDAKGKETFLPPPIPAWQKRREAVEKKLGRTAKAAAKKKKAVKKNTVKSHRTGPAKKTAVKKTKRS